MDLLVIGANGLLGSNIVFEGQRRGWTVKGTYHSSEPDFDIPLIRFDLRDYDFFNALLDIHDPDIAVNCAAMTDVDRCETESERAQIINGGAPGFMAESCDKQGINFVHVSTDYVFNGKKNEPYRESDEMSPIQVYGESKLNGERVVRKSMEDVLITRLSFVWGIHRSSGQLTGFPAWVRDQLCSETKLPLFTDQWVTPTRAGQAADTILDLIEMGADGDYHVACRSCVSPYEFGTTLTEYLDPNSPFIEKSSTEEVDRRAPRPKYSCLNVSKVESTLGRSQPTLREDIERNRNKL